MKYENWNKGIEVQRRRQGLDNAHKCLLTQELKVWVAGVGYLPLPDTMIEMIRMMALKDVADRNKAVIAEWEAL